MALIGISGKIGSGKDTVAGIIQHLVAVDKGITYASKDPNYPTEIIKNHGMLPVEMVHVTGWEVKKFAGKLKQIVALLTGCTVTQLEDQDFKNSTLSKEWDKIALSWETSKSFELAEKFGYNFDELEKSGMIPADRQKIKDDCLNKARLEGWSPANTQPDLWTRGYERERVPVTYREVLQKIGTEAMRDNIHVNVWVNALFADYKNTFSINIHMVDMGKGTTSPPLTDGVKGGYPNWIISDMRFPNEMQAIKERDGITIRIDRKPFNRMCKDCQKPYHLTIRSVECPNCKSMRTFSAMQEGSSHPSETALDNSSFDYTIENNGTIEDLIKKVKTILVSEKIICE